MATSLIEYNHCDLEHQYAINSWVLLEKAKSDGRKSIFEQLTTEQQ